MHATNGNSDGSKEWGCMESTTRQGEYSTQNTRGKSRERRRGHKIVGNGVPGMLQPSARMALATTGSGQNVERTERRKRAKTCKHDAHNGGAMHGGGRHGSHEKEHERSDM